METLLFPKVTVPLPKQDMAEKVLRQMEEEAEKVIEKDEEKMEKEAKKIAHLECKIEKERRKYIKLQRRLSEAEEIEDELQAEKLKRAEEKLLKLKESHDETSSVTEKIEEVFQEAKHFTKDMFENVADFAHLHFADKKEQREHEKVESKTEKKLRAAAQQIDHLKKKLAKKRETMIEEDDKLLKTEEAKIHHLLEQLQDEERKYDEIAAERAEELEYEARIFEEERKVKKLKLAEEYKQNKLSDYWSQN